MNPIATMKRPKLVVSKCLLGQRVRFDGTHKEDKIVKNIISKYMELIPVCPEVECGLGVPREPMILAKKKGETKLINKNTGYDHTHQMKTWIDSKIKNLKKEPIAGFILKSKSPSCGLMVNVFNQDLNSVEKGPGIWANTCIKEFEELPKIQENHLYNFFIRDNFFCSVLIINRWQTVKNAKDLYEFHRSHFLFLKSKSSSLFKELEQIIKKTTEIIRPKDINVYKKTLIRILELKITRKFFLNLLCEATAILKEPELKRVLNCYESKKINEATALEVLRFFAIKSNYLKTQFYIKPLPFDLELRYINSGDQPC